MKKCVYDPRGQIYDLEIGSPNGGIGSGTVFEDIPSDWICPLYGIGEDMLSIAEGQDAR